MLELSKRSISCPIFLSKEGTIGTLYGHLFESGSFEDKTMQTTYELLDETGELINCSQFDKNKDECRMCRRICRFREKIANQALQS